MTTAHHVLTWTGSFVLATAFVVIVTVGLSWLFTRGGTPSEENGALYYRLRPGMRVMAYALILGGVCAIVAGCRSLSQAQDLLWMLEVFGGVAMLLGAAFMLSASLYLDEVGLHYRRGWGRVTTIRWKELDHYEVVRAPRTNTSVYFFRSVDGATIPVEETGYDVKDLLARMGTRRKIQEHPYQRRHWYGG